MPSLLFGAGILPFIHWEHTFDKSKRFLYSRIHIGTSLVHKPLQSHSQALVCELKKMSSDDSFLHMCGRTLTPCMAVQWFVDSESLSWSSKTPVHFEKTQNLSPVTSETLHTEFTLPGCEAINALLQILSCCHLSESLKFRESLLSESTRLQALNISDQDQCRIQAYRCEPVRHTPHSLSASHTYTDLQSLAVWLPSISQ